MRPGRRLHFVIGLVAILLTGSGCTQETRPLPSSLTTELRIGFGLASGQNALAGVNQVVTNIASEALINFSRDGRSQPWLAESIVVGGDGLTWQINLRPNVSFHNGLSADANTLTTVLRKQLDALGTPARDIADVVTVDANRIDVKLHRRSNLALEGLGGAIQAPGAVAVGTGPFALASSTATETVMTRNAAYYGGSSAIERIVIKPYDTVRAAWADMLRGQVDMLYEVGIDALDSLEPSSNTKVFSFPRPYAYLAILNTARPALRSPAIRRALNAAIDREQFIRDALDGHGQPATGPVSPSHWANAPTAPAFTYAPTPLETPLRFTCLYADRSQERLALVVKRMLEAIGVTVTLELVPSDDALGRVQRGDFDAVLFDTIQGPGLLRPYWFWRTGEQFNWGHYSNTAVDAAFDDIRGAADDAAYRRAVESLLGAIVDDPPAIFLAWSERARAVSTRFDVPVQPGRDILGTLRLWKPLGSPPTQH